MFRTSTNPWNEHFVVSSCLRSNVHLFLDQPIQWRQWRQRSEGIPNKILGRKWATIQHWVLFTFLEILGFLVHILLQLGNVTFQGSGSTSNGSRFATASIPARTLRGWSRTHRGLSHPDPCPKSKCTNTCHSFPGNEIFLPLTTSWRQSRLWTVSKSSVFYFRYISLITFRD